MLLLYSVIVIVRSLNKPYVRIYGILSYDTVEIYVYNVYDDTLSNG